MEMFNNQEIVPTIDFGKKEYEKACGCIIIENNRVLLVQQTNGDWGFPKGHVKGNETEVETAIREVKEETNVDVKVEEDKRYSIEYDIEDGEIHKQVVYFVASKIGGDIAKQESEINVIQWLNFEEAMKQITYDDLRNIFRQVLEGHFSE